MQDKVITFPEISFGHACVVASFEVSLLSDLPKKDSEHCWKLFCKDHGQQVYRLHMTAATERNGVTATSQTCIGFVPCSNLVYSDWRFLLFLSVDPSDANNATFIGVFTVFFQIIIHSQFNIWPLHLMMLWNIQIIKGYGIEVSSYSLSVPRGFAPESFVWIRNSESLRLLFYWGELWKFNASVAGILYIMSPERQLVNKV